MGEDTSPTDPALGCKRAAIRKLEHELGIPSASLSVEDFVYMTRIHYLADSVPDPAWGEHEVDYVFVVQKDVEMKLNPNEVSEVVYVTKEELKAMMRKAELHRGESQAVLLAEEDEEEKKEEKKKKKGNSVKIGPPPPPQQQTETKAKRGCQRWR
jgi:isopentenyldiphosphate isomerase